MAGEKELLRPLGVEPIPAKGIEELAAQLEHDLKIDHVSRERLAHLVQGTLGLVLECQPDPHQLHRRGRPPKIALSLIIFWLREVFEDLGRPAGTSSRRGDDQRIGPFVRFVGTYLKYAEPGRHRAVLGDSIRKILRQTPSRFRRGPGGGPPLRK